MNPNLNASLNKLVAHAAVLKVKGILESNSDISDKFMEASTQFGKEINEQLKDIGGELPAAGVEALLAYKTAVGDEMFASIAANPNLQTMAETHWATVGKNLSERLIDILLPLFKGHDITRDDIRYALENMSTS